MKLEDVLHPCPFCSAMEKVFLTLSNRQIFIFSWHLISGFGICLSSFFWDSDIARNRTKMTHKQNKCISINLMWPKMPHEQSIQLILLLDWVSLICFTSLELGISKGQGLSSILLD